MPLPLQRCSCRQSHRPGQLEILSGSCHHVSLKKGSNVFKPVQDLFGEPDPPHISRACITQKKVCGNCWWKTIGYNYNYSCFLQGRSQDFREGGADQSKWVPYVSTPKLGGLGACSPRIILKFTTSETVSGGF